MRWLNTMFTSNDPIHCLEPTNDGGLSPVSTSAYDIINYYDIISYDIITTSTNLPTTQTALSYIALPAELLCDWAHVCWYNLGDDTMTTTSAMTDMHNPIPI